jgi:hypothetical protein
MIPLDSRRWSELRDTYGHATPVSTILRTIDAGEASDEVWTNLWSRICHQGDVCEASYAAVPHLVRIARDPAQIRWDLLALPAAIEAARLTGRAPGIPEDLAAAYHAAVQALADVCFARAQVPWDHVGGQAILAGLAASKGLGMLAEAILELGPGSAGEFLESIGKGGRHGV